MPHQFHLIIGRFLRQKAQVRENWGGSEGQAQHEWLSYLKTHVKIMWNMRSLLYSFSNE